MFQQVPPGRYVIAVSGGVDSVVLFAMLCKRTDIELIVAHFDHGLRKDSIQDRIFVEELAKAHNKQFESARVDLGDHASEDKARIARYNFLRRVCKKYNAPSLVLAHHQDDLIETAIINLIRGTGRRGLSSLQSTTERLRPLLNIPKAQILAYAKAHHLQWREDSTNADERYLRNYVRLRIMPRIPVEARAQFLALLSAARHNNRLVDDELRLWLAGRTRLRAFTRYDLIMLPTRLAYELLQQAFKEWCGNTFERSVAERALLFCRTARMGKYFVLGPQTRLLATRNQIIVECGQR